MKKPLLLLLLVIATFTTTTAFVDEGALFYFDILKSKTRIRDENGDFGEWKKPEKIDNMMVFYSSYGGVGSDVIKVANMKKKVVFATYKYHDTGNLIKDDIQYMSFECTDKYGDPLEMIISFYPSSASVRTAEWVKITEKGKNYQREYEAHYQGR